MINVDSDFNHCIEINRGLGPIQFGLSIDEVRGRLGQPDETEIVDPATQSTKLLYYSELRLQIIFQSPDGNPPTVPKEVKSIVQLATSHPASILWGTKIIGRTEDEILRLFGEHGYAGFIDTRDTDDASRYKSLRMESIRVTLGFRNGLLWSVLWGKVD
jgi:hypothetical protein